MRKIISVFLLTVCIFSLCNCGLTPKNTLKNSAEKHLSISLDEATVIEEWDNHGGPHGDGETFVKLSCPDGFEKNLTKDWKPLPLEGQAYTYFYEWGGIFEHPETEERLIPEVKNGYWFFKSTGPMNWDFALLDCNENILYYYEFDA